MLCAKPESDRLKHTILLLAMVSVRGDQECLLEMALAPRGEPMSEAARELLEDDVERGDGKNADERRCQHAAEHRRADIASRQA